MNLDEDEFMQLFFNDFEEVLNHLCRRCHIGRVSGGVAFERVEGFILKEVRALRVLCRSQEMDWTLARRTD